DVLLWPDNDEPGTTCMNALAQHLLTIGAQRVQLVDLALFRQRPGLVGGEPTFSQGGEWPEGADAADAQAGGWTAAHMAELVSTGELFCLPGTPAPAPTAKQTSNTPAVAAGYRVSADGVYLVAEDGEARQI